MIIVITSIVAIAVVAFVLGVRARDLPVAEPESPFQHLDERKAAIYENLRDLQFEYRVGKLSDADYQNTKKHLQQELAGVLGEVDRVKARLGMNGAAPPAKARVNPSGLGDKALGDKALGDKAMVCPACGAKFEKDLKFCGECGKPLKAVRA